MSSFCLHHELISSSLLGPIHAGEEDVQSVPSRARDHKKSLNNSRSERGKYGSHSTVPWLEPNSDFPGWWFVGAMGGCWTGGWNNKSYLLPFRGQDK